VKGKKMPDRPCADRCQHGPGMGEEKKEKHMMPDMPMKKKMAGMKKGHK